MTALNAHIFAVPVALTHFDVAVPAEKTWNVVSDARLSFILREKADAADATSVRAFCRGEKMAHLMADQFTREAAVEMLQREERKRAAQVVSGGCPVGGEGGLAFWGRAAHAREGCNRHTRRGIERIGRFQRISTKQL